MAKFKCKFCGESTDAQVKFPAGWFCDFTHAISYAKAKQKKDRERLINNVKKKERKSIKVRKENLKTVNDWIKEAQTAVNKYIRMRDYGKPCVSCGSNPEQKRGGTMDAGHYRSRGAASHLRFNLFNIHAQCVKCNRFGSGNAVDYRIQLIERIGLDRVERLEHDNECRRFSIDYLKRVKRIFNKRSRFYENRLALK